MTKKIFMMVILATFILASNKNSYALTIKPDYDGFTGTKLKVLEAAVKAWSDFFSCSDGQTIALNFTSNPNLGSGIYGYTTTQSIYLCS